MTFNWYAEPCNHKTVKLSNVYMCKSISCNDIMRALRGIGLYEWERHMSYVLSQEVLKAFDCKEKAADITRMFSCNLVGVDEFGEHTKTQKEVCEFLLEKLFKTERETPEEMVVSLRGDVFKR